MIKIKDGSNNIIVSGLKGYLSNLCLGKFCDMVCNYEKTDETVNFTSKELPKAHYYCGDSVSVTKELIRRRIADLYGYLPKLDKENFIEKFENKCAVCYAKNSLISLESEIEELQKQNFENIVIVFDLVGVSIAPLYINGLTKEIATGVVEIILFDSCCTVFEALNSTFLDTLCVCSHVFVAPDYKRFGVYKEALVAGSIPHEDAGILYCLTDTYDETLENIAEMMVACGKCEHQAYFDALEKNELEVVNNG